MAFYAENGNLNRSATSGVSLSIQRCLSNQDASAETDLDGASDGSYSSDLSSEDCYPTANMPAISTESSSMDTSMTLKQIRYLSPTTYVRSELKSSSVESGTSSVRLDQLENDDETNGYISIPPLNLDHVVNWSGNDLTYTHRKVEEKNSKEMIRKTEAFKEWLSAKIESEKYAKSQKMEMENRMKKARDQNEIHRKIAREQKLRKWIEDKERAAAVQMEKLRKQQEDIPCSNNMEESIKKNFNAWLEKKVRYEKAVRAEQKEIIIHRSELERMRRERAANNFKKWLEGAPFKPKPVPLNKGLLSLKGSTSKMFVNPKPWVFDTGNEYPRDANTI